MGFAGNPVDLAVSRASDLQVRNRLDPSYLLPSNCTIEDFLYIILIATQSVRQAGSPPTDRKREENTVPVASAEPLFAFLAPAWKDKNGKQQNNQTQRESIPAFLSIALPSILRSFVLDPNIIHHRCGDSPSSQVHRRIHPQGSHDACCERLIAARSASPAAASVATAATAAAAHR